MKRRRSFVGGVRYVCADPRVMLTRDLRSLRRRDNDAVLGKLSSQRKHAREQGHGESLRTRTKRSPHGARVRRARPRPTPDISGEPRPFVARARRTWPAREAEERDKRPRSAREATGPHESIRDTPSPTTDGTDRRHAIAPSTTQPASTMSSRYPRSRSCGHRRGHRRRSNAASPPRLPGTPPPAPAHRNACIPTQELRPPAPSRSGAQGPKRPGNGSAARSPQRRGSWVAGACCRAREGWIHSTGSGPWGTSAQAIGCGWSGSALLTARPAPRALSDPTPNRGPSSLNARGTEACPCTTARSGT